MQAGHGMCKEPAWRVGLPRVGAPPAGCACGRHPRWGHAPQAPPLPGALPSWRGQTAGQMGGPRSHEIKVC